MSRPLHKTKNKRKPLINGLKIYNWHDKEGQVTKDSGAYTTKITLKGLNIYDWHLSDH